MTTEHPSVMRLRDYLRIKTVYPEPDYESAIRYLTDITKDLPFEVQRLEPLPHKPVLILTCPGQDRSLPSLMLNSHMDVVPAEKELWKCDPFEGYKDEEGNIIARGVQDMKAIGMQYIEAVRRLFAENKRLRRTVHVTFVPDEEMGGTFGMKPFVETPEFKALNVGLALDEGIASESDVFNVYYTERIPWWLKVICKGNTGHGSKLPDNTAAEKLFFIEQKFYAFREEQKRQLASDPSISLGDVVSLNLTTLKGGSQPNVVPAELTATFDIRVPPTLDTQFKEKGAMSSICVDDKWWKALTDVMNQLHLKFCPSIFPAATDSRYLRMKNIPAYGFSPMIHTPVLYHDHNEYLNESVYLAGIDIFVRLIERLANVD